MGPITELNMKSLFDLAGFKILRYWQLAHSYSPYNPRETLQDTLDNALYRASRPSWFVKTEFGFIELNLRKRVVEIDWYDTGLETTEVTADEVTKDSTHVHAHSLEKALEYLTILNRLLHKSVK